LPLHASGHAGAATASARVEQLVDELCFYCWALDVALPAPSEPPSKPADRTT